jgi:hypothetical protein
VTSQKREVPLEEMKALKWIDEEGNLPDFFKTQEQGAATSVYAALAPGQYECNII